MCDIVLSILVTGTAGQFFISVVSCFCGDIIHSMNLMLLLLLSLVSSVPAHIGIAIIRPNLFYNASCHFISSSCIVYR